MVSKTDMMYNIIKDIQEKTDKIPAMEQHMRDMNGSINRNAKTSSHIQNAFMDFSEMVSKKHTELNDKIAVNTKKIYAASLIAGCFFMLLVAVL